MRKLDLSDTKSIRAFAEGFLAGEALGGRKPVWEWLVHPGASYGPYIRTITILLDRFYHVNQQDSDLARAWWVDKLGRIHADVWLSNGKVRGISSLSGLVPWH